MNRLYEILRYCTMQHRESEPLTEIPKYFGVSAADARDNCEPVETPWGVRVVVHKTRALAVKDELIASLSAYSFADVLKAIGDGAALQLWALGSLAGWWRVSLPDVMRDANRTPAQLRTAIQSMFAAGLTDQEIAEHLTRADLTKIIAFLRTLGA